MLPCQLLYRRWIVLQRATHRDGGRISCVRVEIQQRDRPRFSVDLETAPPVERLADVDTPQPVSQPLAEAFQHGFFSDPEPVESRLLPGRCQPGQQRGFSTGEKPLRETPAVGARPVVLDIDTDFRTVPQAEQSLSIGMGQVEMAVRIAAAGYKTGLAVRASGKTKRGGIGAETVRQQAAQAAPRDDEFLPPLRVPERQPPSQLIAVQQLLIQRTDPCRDCQRKPPDTQRSRYSHATGTQIKRHKPPQHNRSTASQSHYRAKTSQQAAANRHSTYRRLRKQVI